MAVRNVKISEDVFNSFRDYEHEAGEVDGYEFVDFQETGEHDNHGGVLTLIVVRKTSNGQLYVGEFAVDPAEGDIYETPRMYYPVTATERTVVVVDYLPIIK